MKYPAVVHRPPARVYAGLAELEYPFHDRAILVTSCGRICIGRRKIRVERLRAPRLALSALRNGRRTGADCRQRLRECYGTTRGAAMVNFVLYVAILRAIGIVPLAVTTSLNINFLRRPAADCDIIALSKALITRRQL